MSSISERASRENNNAIKNLHKTFADSVVLEYTETLPRLRLLFSETKSDDVVCSSSPKEDATKIFCKLKRPLTDHRFIRKTKQLGKGMFGVVFEGVIDELFRDIDPRLVGQEVVVKQSLNTEDSLESYRDALHELLIQQGALRELVVNGLPNFSMLYTYIVCVPRSVSPFSPFCTDHIIDLSKYKMEELDRELSLGHLQLLGVYQKVDGIQFDSFLETNPGDFAGLVNALSQIFLALNEANLDGRRFTHGDLSARNVMITNNAHPFVYNNQYVLDPVPAHQAVIIDYGKSAAKFTFGRESYVVVNHDSILPESDILFLLRDVLIVVGDNNTSSVFLNILLTDMFGKEIHQYLNTFKSDDSLIAWKYEEYGKIGKGSGGRKGLTYLDAAFFVQKAKDKTMKMYPSLSPPSSIKHT